MFINLILLLMMANNFLIMSPIYLNSVLCMLTIMTLISSIMTFKHEWLSMSLFLLFLGGILILFSYISIISINESKKQNKLIMILILIFVFSMKSTMIKYNLMKTLQMNINMMNLISLNSVYLIFMMIIITLMLMMIINLLSTKWEGSMRSSS